VVVAERITSATTLDLADPRWRAFVEASDAATPFHHPDWANLVADCYRFKAFVVATAEPSGTITAGLPVVEVRQPLRGSRWVSLPFTDHVPPLLAPGDDGPGLAAALAGAVRAAGVREAEIRGDLPGAAPTGWPALRHVLELDPDPQAVYAGFHPSQVKRSIKKGEREGLTVRTGSRQEDLTEVFYGLHLRTRRRQGVPIQPKRFFRLLWDRIIARGMGSVLVVDTPAGDPIAAAVFVEWNRTVVYKFGASDESAWSLRPNHLLFWHAIRTACERGDRWFDFGRTDADHDGLSAFKRSWGAREEPLVYHAVGGGAGRSGPPGGRASRALAAVIRRTPPVVCQATGELLYRFAA
jgi:CelD/BcsL family acetyltransferase involved in cellulose biosynthesis